MPTKPPPKKKERTGCESAYAALALLMGKPRSCPEIAGLLGMSRNQVAVFMEAALAEGLAERVQNDRFVGRPLAIGGSLPCLYKFSFENMPGESQ